MTSDDPPEMDRRTGKERRTAPRFPLDVEIEWEGASPRRAGTVTDMSLTGCFVLTGGEVDDGEILRLFFPLSDGMKVQVFAEVTNHVHEIGFAARFFDVTPTQHEFLENFVAVNKAE